MENHSIDLSSKSKWRDLAIIAVFAFGAACNLGIYFLVQALINR